MGEESIFCARGEVLHYCAETNSWESLDGGLSRIDIYCLPDVRYRVVAVAAESHNIVMNMPIFHELKCTSLSQVFRQLAALNYTYGINFVKAADASSFTEVLNGIHMRIADVAVAPVPLRALKTRYAKLASLNSVADIPPPSPPPPEDDHTPTSPKSLVTELALQEQIEARKNRSKKSSAQHHSMPPVLAPTPSVPPAGSTTEKTAPEASSKDKSSVFDALRTELKAFAKLEIDTVISGRGQPQPQPQAQPTKKRHSRRQSKDSSAAANYRDRSRSSSTVSTDSIEA